MTQWIKAIVLNIQKSHFPFSVMLVIKTVLFTFCPTKTKLNANNKDKDFDFINILVASKFENIMKA